MKEDAALISKASLNNSSEAKEKQLQAAVGKIKVINQLASNNKRSGSTRKASFGKYLSGSVANDSVESNSEVEEVKLPPVIDKKRVSIQLILFPKASVRQNDQSSVEVTIPALERQNSINETFLDPRAPSEPKKVKRSPKFPTLLTSVGSKDKNKKNSKNLARMNSNSEEKLANLVPSPFLPLSTVSRTEEYTITKTKLTNSDRIATLRRHLKYNERSAEKYKKAVNKANRSLIDDIVNKYRSAPDIRFTIEPKIIKKISIEINEQREEEPVSKIKPINRDILLTWHPRKEMNGVPLEYREGRRVCTKGWLVYILGGYSTGGGQIDTLFCYDASSNLLKACASGKTFPPPRAHHSMVMINNSLYIFGGEMIKRGVSLLTYDDVWKYDLNISKFRQIKTQSRIDSRKLHTACAFGNNFMLVYGGVNDNGQTLSDFHILILSTVMLP